MIKNNIVAIIQARIGSTRLPRKVLMDIVGKPMLWHILERVKKSKMIDSVVVATTNKNRDKLIAELAQKSNVEIFVGDEENVLDRYFQAAKRFNANTIIRITSDCPLIDPRLVDKIIEYYLKNQNEIDYIAHPENYPEGVDTEVFSFRTLEKTWKGAWKPSDREHVTSYITNHPEIFRLVRANSEIDGDFSSMHWSVDQECDLEFVRKVYEKLYKDGELFYIEDVLNLLEKYPELMEINKGFTGYEGHYKLLKEDEEKMRKKRNLTKSIKYWNRGKEIIPCGTQTLSKAPSQFVEGVYPIYLDSGKGSRVFDVDENEYIDYALALGAITLGYGYPVSSEAVKNQLSKGAIFSLMHPLEIELAELLIANVPCAEMVRFAKNGSDVTSAAVRLSRAYTGREKIAYCGYHGWQDWYAVTTERNKGIPQVLKNLIYSFEYNNIKSLNQVFEENKNEIAAVIMEQGIVEPENDFLKKVKELAHKNNALLIFDEIVTGFRYALGGIQECYGVVSDLACVGKGIANGMPISAVVGKKEIMKKFEEVFFSMTFGGEALSLASAVATIKEIKEKNVIEHFWKQGKRLKEGFNKIAKDFGIRAEFLGAPPRLVPSFKDSNGNDSMEMMGLFMQEAIKRGVLFRVGGNFTSYSHTDEDIRKTLEICEDSLKVLKKAMDEGNLKKYMEGKIPQVVFKPKPAHKN